MEKAPAIRRVSGSKRVDGARQLFQAGVTAFPLLPLRAPVLARLGPAPAWALLAALSFVPFLVKLVRNDAEPWLYGAMGSAAIGIFLCNWGAIAALRSMLASRDSYASVLQGEREEIGQVFLSRFLGACSFVKTVVGGLVIAALIIGALAYQHRRAPSTAFSHSFVGIYYVLLFFSAFGIGVGHVLILCLLRLVHIVDEFGFRKLHSIVRVYELSRGYVRLASIALMVYVNYLVYLYCMWLGGIRFSPLVNGVAAVVGAIVMVVYIYPQLVIHKALKKNRQLLVEEASAHLDRITADRDPISRERQEEILKALDYLARVQATPTWGFQFRELAAVVIGYAIPLLTFLEAQGARLLSLL